MENKDTGTQKREETLDARTQRGEQRKNTGINTELDWGEVENRNQGFLEDIENLQENIFMLEEQIENMQEIIPEERQNKYIADEQLEQQLQGGDVNTLKEELIEKDRQLQNTIYWVQKLKQRIENAQDSASTEASNRINELEKNIQQLKKNLEEAQIITDDTLKDEELLNERRQKKKKVELGKEMIPYKD